MGVVPKLYVVNDCIKLHIQLLALSYVVHLCVHNSLDEIGVVIQQVSDDLVNARFDSVLSLRELLYDEHRCRPLELLQAHYQWKLLSERTICTEYFNTALVLHYF